MGHTGKTGTVGKIGKIGKVGKIRTVFIAPHICLSSFHISF
jgi:hypothetical protein